MYTIPAQETTLLGRSERSDQENAYDRKNQLHNSLWWRLKNGLNKEKRNMAFPESVIERAWQRSGGECEVCNKKLSRYNHNEGEWGAWEAHHITPQSKGGDDSLSNCKILCLDCHKRTRSYGRH